MPEASNTYHYNETFAQEFARLNEAQRRAVEHIEGPVLVVAGPGTGKTHILAARIGQILLKTDAQPHNILCLTFTDAGVKAMRQRLLTLIGPEAHKVHIFTFHSFCNNIIRDNLEFFGRRDLEPLSDLERVEVIRKMLDELPLSHPLKKGRADIYFYESHLQSLFRHMKMENWTVAFVEEKIDEYLDDLPNREEFVYKVNRGEMRKGSPKTALIQDEQAKMERLRSAAALFPLYETKLAALRRYDYEDMILWVLRAFRERPSLLRYYQEQYLYFLVDEYQDTNGAQNEVLRRLVEYWEQPNVFIVGDDDQSIYEFQGARLKNITDFFVKYAQSLETVVLKDNYRSTQLILNTAGALIRENKLRLAAQLSSLGIDKKLTARHTDFAKVTLHPTITEYPNRLHEEVAIVRALEQMQNEEIPLGEVAVIYAKHRQVNRLMELLEKKGIPYRTRRPVNVLDLPLIQNLRSVLAYLQAESVRPYSGEYLLFRLLHFHFFGVLPRDLARLAIHLMPNAGAGKHFWRDAIADRAFLKKCKLKNPAAVGRLSKFLEAMLGEYVHCSVPAFIERVINRSGMLARLVSREKGGGPQPGLSAHQSLQALYTFMEFVKKEAARNPRLTLTRLLEIFENMDANRLPIALLQPPSAEAPFSTGRQAVNLVTAHSSKGLEFRRVFMLDCVKDHWEPAKRGGKYQFSFPDTLTLSGSTDEMEARRRLFYVAMTRAKEALHISFAAQNDDGKELLHTAFVDEILSAAKLELRREAMSDAVIAEAQMALLIESKPAAEPHDSEAVQAILEHFSLSVSSLNKYLRCPLSFYYENVLRVPVMASEAANFGFAIHGALQRGFEQMLLNKEHLFPPPEEFVRLFKVEMERMRGLFSAKEFERRLTLGRQLLQDYYRHHVSQWRREVQVEKSFKRVEVNGVPLTGTIDRIDYSGGLPESEPGPAEKGMVQSNSDLVHIVDYKTGSHNAARLRRPSANNPHGGTYWRQLVFYKILFENWRLHPFRVTTAEISYLQPDAKGQYPRKVIRFEPRDTEFMKDLIADTYAKIMRQEFYKGCGEPNCPWCTFLLQQEQVDSFADREIEALDD
ncbi:MAG: ATP-dependent helicase [Saprospiraceae bacterium]